MSVIKRIYDAIANTPASVAVLEPKQANALAQPMWSKREEAKEQFAALQSIDPIRTFDSIPEASSRGMAVAAYGGWQNSVASISANNSLTQYSRFMLSRLSYQECAVLTTDPFISRAVSTIVSEMFKEGGLWERRGDDTAFDIKSLETVSEEFNLSVTVKTACLRALEYGGAMIYIDTTDKRLDEPLLLTERTLSNSRLKGFRVVEPWQYAPVEVNAVNPLKSDYMRPNLWWVNGATSNVHHSRLIPITFFSVVDLLKPMYNYMGLPLSFFMRDFVSSAETSRKSVADMMLRFKTDYFKTTAQKIENPQMQARVKFINQTRNNLGTVLLTEDEELNQVVTPISGLGDLVSQQYEILTAITGLPITKFMGQTPRGFNATGEHDLENHYDTIATYQNNIALPIFERLGKAIAHLALGVPYSPRYTFNPLDRLTAKEKSEINNLNADYINKAMQAGVATNADGLKALQTGNYKFPWLNPDEFEEQEANTDKSDENDTQSLDEFKESDHPRGDDGKFGKGSGGGKKEKKKDERTSEETFGTAYTEYSGKPKEAIEKLLKEKQGHVPAAIYKEGIGNIDFVYGNDDYGIKHIIEKRNKQGYDGEKFVESLPNLISEGKVYSNIKEKNKVYIGTKNNEIVVRLDWYGESKKWLITAYKRF